MTQSGEPPYPIAGADGLYRRLVPDHFKKRDSKLTPGAYYVKGRPDPEASVDLARLTLPERTRAQKPGAGVGEILAQVPMDLGLTVAHVPLEGNIAHSQITGLQPDDKERCTCLAKATTVLYYPTGIAPPK